MNDNLEIKMLVTCNNYEISCRNQVETWGSLRAWIKTGGDIEVETVADLPEGWLNGRYGQMFCPTCAPLVSEFHRTVE